MLILPVRSKGVVFPPNASHRVNPNLDFVSDTSSHGVVLILNFWRQILCRAFNASPKN